MEFTNLEKRAIIKVLGDIMFADGKIAVGEEAYMLQIFELLNISEADTNESLSMKVTEALAILSQMSDDKKKALAIMMQQMIKADNDIDENEMKIFIAVFAGIGIPLPEDLK